MIFLFIHTSPPAGVFISRMDQAWRFSERHQSAVGVPLLLSWSVRWMRWATNVRSNTCVTLWCGKFSALSGGEA